MNRKEAERVKRLVAEIGADELREQVARGEHPSLEGLSTIIATEPGCVEFAQELAENAARTGKAPIFIPIGYEEALVIELDDE